MNMHITWHQYKYYPYEKELGAREISSLLNGVKLKEIKDGFKLTGSINTENAKRLTYFSTLHNNHGSIRTFQAKLEDAAKVGKNRQATRYSVHGIHEYKGKFNPQVAKAILNIFNIQKGDIILDPFCGSGTTLVECAHLGVRGYGTDINPLAVYIANTKLHVLLIPAEQLDEKLNKLSTKLASIQKWTNEIKETPRSTYLHSWFDASMLQKIEILKLEILNIAEEFSPFFLVIASNLLREYSHQDPKDLRIRRRKSPLPQIPFEVAFIEASRMYIKKLAETQEIIDFNLPLGEAHLQGVTTLAPKTLPCLFDGAITSPPYAMALPYIDTQRLSLVWLDLIEASEILQLESELIGSREVRGTSRHNIHTILTTNSEHLPQEQADYCLMLQKAIGVDDGFRRQAVPGLLYRYFSAMQKSFISVRQCLKQGANFALIVGHNHTTLGGMRYNIDTPKHLASIAFATGWRVTELFELQAYRRYGYHANNAISTETLMFLQNP